MAEVAEAIGAGRGVSRVLLQAGIRGPDAAALYSKLGYASIPVLDP